LGLSQIPVYAETFVLISTKQKITRRLLDASKEEGVEVKTKVSPVIQGTAVTDWHCSQFGVRVADNKYMKDNIKIVLNLGSGRLLKKLQAGRSGVRIPALAVGVPNWHCGRYVVRSIECFDGPFSDEVVLGKYRYMLLLSGSQNCNFYGILCSGVKLGKVGWHFVLWI
jgi:hypothetical protein